MGRYWNVLEGFTVITKLITTCITVDQITLLAINSTVAFIDKI